jgi:hypothetical protein
MKPVWLQPSSLLVLLGACAGPSLQGAILIEPGHDLGANDWLAPADCRDARGAPAAAPALYVARAMLSDGREVLLERRVGYDTVLVTNSYPVVPGRIRSSTISPPEAPGRVFEYVSDDGSQGKVLHVLHMPLIRLGAHLELADEFHIQEKEQGFRATARRITLRCALIPAPRAGAPG